MRNCVDCKKDIIGEKCDKLDNQKKKFPANLNELKRQAPNEFGHMFPKNKMT